MTVAICITSMEKRPFRSSYFKSDCFLMLNSMSSLYILDINALSVISFADLFSHPVGCVLILLMASLTVQTLFVLLLLPLPEETDPKKYC